MPPDPTGAPLDVPAPRALRLQALARGGEGFLLGLAYSAQRGYGRTHAFAGELRIGMVEAEVPELGFVVEINTAGAAGVPSPAGGRVREGGMARSGIPDYPRQAARRLTAKSI